MSMRIRVPDTLDQAAAVMEPLYDAAYYVPEDVPEECVLFDYWLAYSKDGQTWALFEIEHTGGRKRRGFGFIPPNLVAWLTDPPKQDDATIGKILFEVHRTRQNGQALNERVIRGIAARHPFPVYKPLGHYLPTAPEVWLDLPAELVVGFELSEGACLYKGIFEEYRRESFEDAMEILLSPRCPGLLFGYSLFVRELVPMTPFEVDWPLARRGKDMPYRRGKMGGVAPWESRPNTKLVGLYQSVPCYVSNLAPHYFAEPTIRLVVAGGDNTSTIDDWHRVAPHLRKVKRRNLAA